MLELHETWHSDITFAVDQLFPEQFRKISALEQQLVAVLRSGEYKQIQNRLKTPEGYCCLGVASELCFPQTGEYFKPSYDYIYFKVYPTKAENYLSDPATLLLNWQSPHGLLMFNVVKHFHQVRSEISKAHQLDVANDSGFTFDEIATIIESGLVATRY